MAGKISLYRPENCDKPQVAMHELLHALGFDHNNNEKSIMYPLTSCNQELDQDIISEINYLYADPSYADLLIEDLQANKSGRYLGFEIIVSNVGLLDSEDSKLVVYAENEIIKEFDLNELRIGTRKILTVSNIRVPRDFEFLKFEVVSDEIELSKENNIVKIDGNLGI